MSIICELNEISIRELTKDKQDIERLLKWKNNEKVAKYYDGIKKYTIDEVRSKYINKIDEEGMFPCIIEFNKLPIGYIQFYNIDSTIYEIPEEKYKELVEDNQKAMAIDLFIGEDDYRDKGIGTKTIKILIDTLFNKYKVDLILIDPKTNNGRAIKCYKKCGFQECFIQKNREEMNGILYDNLIMVIKK